MQIALSKRKSIDDYSPLEEGSEAHWEVVERILFLYAKLNPGQGYVQGMNEIIGPIYYCFACDPSIEWKGILQRTLISRKILPLFIQIIQQLSTR